MNSDIGFVVGAILIVLVSAVFAGSFRVEHDPLAPRRPRQWSKELVGAALPLGIVALAIYMGRAFPGPHSVAKGPITMAGAVLFLAVGALLIASYFVPEHNAVFRTLSRVWDDEYAPGPSGDRPGLLFLGSVFGLTGLCLLVVGSGLLG